LVGSFCEEVFTWVASGIPTEPSALCGCQSSGQCYTGTALPVACRIKAVIISHVIDSRLRASITRIALPTPEMAHAATTGKHHAQWLAERPRLQALGAPVDPGDLLQVSRRVTRTSVRRLAGEFFEDGEPHTKTLRQFLRWMVTS
jgi:hypothetical protein